MLRVTNTENGMVKGLPGTDARITVFKGVPYAADTSGENRWKVPQPAAKWEGIRNCFEFSPITMQPIPGKDPDAFYSKEWHVDPEVPMSEDSLTVNIWTNAKTGKEKMPVMFWIFGGGLHEGYAYEMEFDGERMASRDIVVVTVAYRLNAFGFLAHPDLTAENPDAPTNFGLLDQQAALNWVKRNIANFGGDPDNITVAGQSAGGIGVFTQFCTPTNGDIVKKVILQSSACGAVFPRYPKSLFGAPRGLKEAEEFGKNFLENVLGVKTIAEARKLDGKFIMDRIVESRTRFNRVVDGKIIEKDVDKYLFDGDMRNVPMLLGYTGDEVPMCAQGETVEEITEWAKKYYGEYADDLMKAWSKNGSDVESIKKASVSNYNEVSTRFVAEEYASQGKTIYCYNFDPDMPGDDAGSFHSSDLWFTFETLMRCWRPFDAHHYDLSRKMCNYWANFIKTGDPNGNDKDGTPMPTWTPYTREQPNVMQFFDEISMEEGPLSEAARITTDANLKSFRADK